MLNCTAPEWFRRVDRVVRHLGDLAAVQRVRPVDVELRVEAQVPDGRHQGLVTM
jgi:hypothetical protein